MAPAISWQVSPKKSCQNPRLARTLVVMSGAIRRGLVPALSLLQHSSHCLVVGKIKSRHLIGIPGFRNQVVANGKASLTQLARYVTLVVCSCIAYILEPLFTSYMTSRMQEDDGVPVTGVKGHTTYYAKRCVEKQQMAVYSEKFQCLPRFLYGTEVNNPGSGLNFHQTLPQASSGPCLPALDRQPRFSVAAVEMFPERTSDIAHRLYFKVYTHLVSIKLVVGYSSRYG
jgi:hypothetical protein